MAEDLQDLRTKITGEAHCALIAHARAHGLEKTEVARDVLHRWALRQIHGATVLQRCLRAKGMAGAAEGIAGQGGESLDWSDE